MNIEHGFLSRRTLNFLVFVFIIGLVVVLVSSERGVSGAMEQIGALVSKLFGH
jgi:hypothetical protein